MIEDLEIKNNEATLHLNLMHGYVHYCSEIMLEICLPVKPNTRWLSIPEFGWYVEDTRLCDLQVIARHPVE
jgi:hypothetical protein